MASYSYTFIDILLSTILALIMLSVGLYLTSSNSKNLFLFPEPSFIGLTSLIIALPI
jgi:predicted Na+-dependent transporter